MDEPTAAPGLKDDMKNRDSDRNERILANARSVLTRAQFSLDTDYFIPCQCDETSVLFSTEAELDAFVAWCKETGLNVFNSVTDVLSVRSCSTAFSVMAQNWQSSAFGVRFEFIDIPREPFPHRIEAMCVTDGMAPLHDRQLRRNGSGTPIHVSFKAPNLHEYLRTAHELNAVLPFMAEYSNDYGRFSYYEHGGIYLKPRVNLRDLQDAEVAG